MKLYPRTVTPYAYPKLTDLLPAKVKSFLAEREHIANERQWQLGYMHGVADQYFPGLIPELQTLKNHDSQHFANGYEWAITHPVALSLPPQD